jgi:hypothetical protein
VQVIESLHGSVQFEPFCCFDSYLQVLLTTSLFQNIISAENVEWANQILKHAWRVEHVFSGCSFRFLCTKHFQRSVSVFFITRGYVVLSWFRSGTLTASAWMFFAGLSASSWCFSISRAFSLHVQIRLIFVTFLASSSAAIGRLLHNAVASFVVEWDFVSSCCSNGPLSRNEYGDWWSDVDSEKWKPGRQISAQFGAKDLHEMTKDSYGFLENRAVKW